MSEFITRTARLVPYAKRPKQMPGFVTAYSYEPLPDDPGAAYGSMFAVIEVLVSGRSSEDVADLIVETFGHHYYNLEQANDDIISRFEAAIKAVNHELTSYVNQGNAAWIGKISAVVAAQAGDELHVAQTGSAEAFLYRGRSGARITTRQPSNRPVTPTKTFGSISSGQLEIGDRILLATPALIHQLSLQQLKDVIANNTPNNAIGELTQLLRVGSGDRIAALVIEATTPELAALQVRSEQPDEIRIGVPETPMEAAKLAAAPIAHATAHSSRQLSSLILQGWDRTRPALTQYGLKFASIIRQQLSHRTGQMRLGAGLLALMVVGFGYWYWQSNVSTASRLFNRYQAAYQQFVVAEKAIEIGDDTTARNILGGLKNELADLGKGNGSKKLNAKLSQSHLPESEPKTVESLAQLVSTRLDQVDDIQRVDAATVASITSNKNAKPTNVEVINGQAYMIDGDNNQVIAVNITTNATKTIKPATGKIGHVIASALSSNNDGIFLLTNTPSVWLLRFDDNSLVEQTISMGQWPAATAIGSYGGNLYLLADSKIYKHTRSLSGFGPKTEYLTTRNASGLKDATAIAVDGSVYVASPSGIQQYISGSLQQTAPMPSTLGKPTSLRSADNGNTLIAISAGSDRIGLWDARQGIAFRNQYIMNGINAVADAAYDPKTKTIYAITDNRIVRFNP